MPISEKNLLKLANGSDVRGVSIEGVADEPVTLNAEAANRITSGFLDFLSQKTGKKVKDLRIAVGHDSRLSAPMLKEAVLDDVAGAQRGLTASPCAAHAVAHKPPCRAAGQLPRPVVVLILLPDAADVCFSCKFHRLLLFRLCRSSRRGGAGRTRR